jgi:peptidoglycan/xylan/chitin deacetylase (PgdA/CDA1 family)
VETNRILDNKIKRRTALRGMVITASALLSACMPVPDPEQPAREKPKAASTRTAVLSPESLGTSDSTPNPTPDIDLNAGIVFAREGDASSSSVAITIDDFAYPYVVKERLLDILDKYPAAKMTMFPIGDRIPEVEKLIPGFWRTLLEQGHEVGFHTMHHDDMGDASTEKLYNELLAFNQAVADAVEIPNFKVRFGRATYGNYGNRTQFREVARELGITWVLWSAIPSSASAPPPARADAVRPGDIALFHIRYQDLYKLPAYIEACQQRDLALVTLRQLSLIAED